MSEVLLINAAEYETRVALLANGVLQAVYFERESSRNITGNIYAGRIVRILPGIQAAFVDFGMDRPGFLHVNEIPGQGEIQNVLHDGQKVLVQISKEQIGGKGARLSMLLSVASRNLVILLNSGHVGVSQKIYEPELKDCLCEMVTGLRKKFGLPNSLGFIVRTNARFADEQELEQDMLYLKNIWEKINPVVQNSQSSGLIYEQISLFVRIVRDLACSETQLIKVDSANAYDELRAYMALQIPQQLPVLEFENSNLALFDSYKIEGQISALLLKDVSLKSGGSIVIEQTEAMVTIDVNTGTFVGKRNPEETVYFTNMEAAREIPRQLRLRNLGGIIIIDFIDMIDPKHRQQVLEELEAAAEKDPERTRISGFSDLGLVEMTRKRDRESLVRQMGETCRECDGISIVKSLQTVCFEIFRALRSRASTETFSHSNSDVQHRLELRLSPELADALQNQESAQFSRQQVVLKVQVQLRVKAEYERSRFELVQA